MESWNTVSFSIRLKELRAKKGVNQSQLAEDLKIGRASVSNYEIGSRVPDADVVMALADYFGVSTDYLLARTNIENEQDAIQHLSKANDIMEKLHHMAADNRKSIMECFNNLIEAYSSAEASPELKDTSAASNLESAIRLMSIAIQLVPLYRIMCASEDEIATQKALEEKVSAIMTINAHCSGITEELFSTLVKSLIPNYFDKRAIHVELSDFIDLQGGDAHGDGN